MGSPNMRRGGSTFPTKVWLYEVVKLAKLHATHTLTVSIDGKGNWQYQTGDNSYMGPCYGHPVWAVVSLPLKEEWGEGDYMPTAPTSGTSANYNCREYASDLLEQLKDGYWQHIECNSQEVCNDHK